MRQYKYKVIIKINDTENKEKLLDSKDEVCKVLGISIASLNNILMGRTKHKFDYLTIEKELIPAKPKIKKELTDEEKEIKLMKQREVNKRFQEKIKRERHEMHKTNILSALDKLP